MRVLFLDFLGRKGFCHSCRDMHGAIPPPVAAIAVNLESFKPISANLAILQPLQPFEARMRGLLIDFLRWKVASQSCRHVRGAIPLAVVVRRLASNHFLLFYVGSLFSLPRPPCAPLLGACISVDIDK